MRQNPWIEEDIALLCLSVEELERYLISNELYWPLYTHPSLKLVNPRSRLTPGNLLLSMRRLSATELKGEKKMLVETKMVEVDRLRSQWKSHWILKAQQEFNARMDLWHAYLEDLFDDKELYARNYTYSVRWRTILQLLGDEGIQFTETTVVTLSAMDENLKAVSLPGPFVWGEMIETSFPNSTFWFLYRKILV